MVPGKMTAASVSAPGSAPFGCDMVDGSPSSLPAQAASSAPVNATNLICDGLASFMRPALIWSVRTLAELPALAVAKNPTAAATVVCFSRKSPEPAKHQHHPWVNR